MSSICPFINWYRWDTSSYSSMAARFTLPRPLIRPRSSPRRRRASPSSGIATALSFAWAGVISYSSHSWPQMVSCSPAMVVRRSSRRASSPAVFSRRSLWARWSWRSWAVLASSSSRAAAAASFWAVRAAAWAVSFSRRSRRDTISSWVRWIPWRYSSRWAASSSCRRLAPSRCSTSRSRDWQTASRSFWALTRSICRAEAAWRSSSCRAARPACSCSRAAASSSSRASWADRFSRSWPAVRFCSRRLRSFSWSCWYSAWARSWSSWASRRRPSRRRSSLWAWSRSSRADRVSPSIPSSAACRAWISLVSPWIFSSTWRDRAANSSAWRRSRSISPRRPRMPALLAR